MRLCERVSFSGSCSPGGSGSVGVLPIVVNGWVNLGARLRDRVSFSGSCSPGMSGSVGVLLGMLSCGVIAFWILSQLGCAVTLLLRRGGVRGSAVG